MIRTACASSVVAQLLVPDENVNVASEMRLSEQGEAATAHVIHGWLAALSDA